MKTNSKYVCAAVLCAFFILLIIAVKTVDVQAIGPNGTEVGFAGINGAFSGIFGFNEFFYKATQAAGLFSILVAGAFGAWGIVQMVARKSPLRVDKTILLLGCLYIAVIILYVLFEKAAVNLRPVIMPGETAPEASFPSTHTMVVFVIMGSAAMVLGKYMQKGTLKAVLQAVCIAVIVFTVIGRLVSGVHWFTDILGGLLISASLLFLFSALLDRIPSNITTGKH